jgi:tRNA pseudouridine55 synthase
LLLNKPAGISSNQALGSVKFLFSAIKAGHTGTLDPMATGLLPVCLGEATKFSSVLLGADKTYQARFRLGYISTTGDAEGKITAAEHPVVAPADLTSLQIEEVLARFTGLITQIPPMFSALKYQGKALYVYAREGIEISRQSRTVTIHELTLQTWNSSEISVTVRCSSGTYIRTLAEDIGKALGCGGAYLTALCRSAIGEYSLLQARTLQEIEQIPAERRHDILHPADSFLQHFPLVVLDAESTQWLLQGKTVNSCIAVPINTIVRLYSAGNHFLGLGTVSATGIIPKRLMAMESPQQKAG